MRVASVLRSLGWQKTLATYLGKRQRVWMKNDLPLDPPDLPVPTLKGEVDRTSNPGLIKDVTTTDPPDPPLSQIFLTDSQHHGDGDRPSHSQSLGSEVVAGGSPPRAPQRLCQLPTDRQKHPDFVIKLSLAVSRFASPTGWSLNY